MPNSCVKCKKNVTEKRNPGLSCVICSKYWHSLCAELSDKALKDLIDNKFSWTCKGCKRRSIILPTPVSSTSITAPEQNSSSASTSNNLSAKRTSSSSNITKANKSPDSNQFLADKLLKLENLLTTALQRIDQLEAQLTLAANKSQVTESLTEKVQKLEVKTATIDKQLNDDILEIQGLPDSALQLPLISVVAVGKEIGCEISEADLTCVPSCTASRISITFKSKAKRRNFLIAGKNFNKDKKKFQHSQQSYRIHVNEVLSENQRSLYRQTKAFANANNFKFVWVGLTGTIYLKKSEGHTPHLIFSSDSLNKIQNEIILPELPRTENESATMSTSIPN